MKKGFFLLMLVMSFVVISTGSVSAADCGGTTECNCGDTVTSSYTMSADITDCPFYGLRIGAPGITLDCAGFTISGAGSNTRAGIASDSNGVGGITVKNCNVEHFPTQAGISLFGDGNTIMENTILNVSAGIGISGYNDNMIIDNTVINSSWGFDSGPGCDSTTVDGNTFHFNNRRGIDLSDCTNSTVTNNIVNFNGDIGIIVGTSTDESNNVIKDNSANFNGFEGIIGGSGSVIERNTAHANGRFGITSLGSNIHVRDNILHLNSLGGMQALGNGGGPAINQIITNNTIHANNRSGVLLVRNFINSTIKGNIIDMNQEHGILYDDRHFENNTIIGNTIRENGQHGIALTHRLSPDLKRSSIEQNIIESNNMNGIFLSGFKNIVMRNNTINMNQEHGIQIVRSNNNSMLHNTVKSNKEAGMFVQASVNNTLLRNAVFNNTRYGILSTPRFNAMSKQNNISLNNITKNRFGIYLNRTNNTIIHGNNVSNNSKEGIFLNHSHHNTVLENELYNNSRFGIRLALSHQNEIINNTANFHYIGINVGLDPALFDLSSDNNTIEGNIMINNSLDGLAVDGDFNNISFNVACLNDNLDVAVKGEQNQGVNNTCNKAGIWNDTGKKGCTFSCSPPIILIHGIYSHDQMWTAMRPQLEEEGLKVYVIGELLNSSRENLTGYFPTNQKIQKSARNLSQAVAKLKELEPEAKEYDIVAHSQGGLVARWYIASPMYDKDFPVRRIVTLTTPHTGSEICSIAGGALLMGAFQGISKRNIANDESCAGGDMIPGSTFLKALEKNEQTNFPNINDVEKKIAVVGTGDKAVSAVVVLDNLFGITGLTGEIPVIGDVIKELGRVTNDIPVPIIDKILSIPFNTLARKAYTWGDDDGVVPAKRQMFPVPGAENVESKTSHSEIIDKDNAVFNDQVVIDFVIDILNDGSSNKLPPYVPGIPGGLPSSEVFSESGDNVDIAFDNILPGETKEKIFYFDPETDLLTKKDFLLIANKTGLDLSLVSPSGEIINDSTNNSNVRIISNETAGIHLISVEDAESGNWKAKVHAFNTTEEVNFTVSVFHETTIVYTFYAHDTVYKPGNEVIITGVVQNDTDLLLDINITAVIGKPDNSTEVLELFDDGLHNDELPGDGIFANKFSNTTLTGIYYMGSVAQLKNQVVDRYGFTAFFVELLPDIELTNMTFLPEDPTEGEDVIIIANVTNVGEADVKNVSILFYNGNPSESGTLIGEKKIDVHKGESLLVNTSWEALLGEHTLFALIDPFSDFIESNYSNNVFNRSIHVEAGMNNFSFKDIAIKKDPNTTRIVDRFKPVVTLISPSYFSISDSIQRVNPINFSYNVTDQSDIRSCDLIINNNVAQTDFSIQKNVEQNFTQSLDNGIYLWQVSCTDASFYKNKGFSQKNIIIVDVP